MINLIDKDPRQVTDSENYSKNHGPFSEVAIQINSALKKIGYYSDADDAEFVGICDALETNFKYKNKKSFCINVWEASSLPRFMVISAINNNQRILGLSEQISKLWRLYGYPNVKTVYGGCDFEYWTPEKNIKSKFLPNGNDFFDFIHINSSHVRSGLDLTIEAFSKAFSKNSNVRLTIKDTNIQNENSKLLQKIKYFSKYYNANINYFSERCSSDDIRDFYRASQVTLNMLRCTSFGMPLIECSACGSLCVTGDTEPTNEIILSEKFGIKLKPNGQIKLSDAITYLSNEWGLPSWYGNFSYFNEPYINNFDIEEYSTLLIDIYKKYDIYKSQIDINLIKKTWSWDNSAKQLIDALYGKI